MNTVQMQKPIDAMEILIAATAEGLDKVLSALCLALYPEGALSAEEQDAIAKRPFRKGLSG